MAAKEDCKNHSYSRVHLPFCIRITNSFCADFFFFLAVQLLLNFYILFMDGDNASQVTVTSKITVNEFLVVNENIISGMAVAIAPNNTLISGNHLRKSRFTSPISSKEEIDIRIIQYFAF